MTLDLLRELDNQAGIPFQNMSSKARAFLNNNRDSLPETTLQETNCYRHPIIDELENKDKIPFREMSQLAREILSGPLFPHVETCTKFLAWTPVTTRGMRRKDMFNMAYRLVIPPMNLDNPELKIFCKLTAEEQKALLKLPYDQVEEYMYDGTWIGNSLGKALHNVGVYRRKPVPKPQWIDIAPHLRSATNLWKITTPEHSSILLTDAMSHAGFIGFVYGTIVCAQLQYKGNSVNPTEPPVKIPDAVRFRTT